MDNDAWEKAGSAAGKFVQQAMDLGLTWDEAVTAFGLAAKAAAKAAASTSDNDCVAIAKQKLEEAFATKVRVVVTIADSEQISEELQSNPLLATAHRRHGGRLH